MQIVVVGYRSDREELLYVNKVLLLRVINLYTWFFQIVDCDRAKQFEIQNRTTDGACDSAKKNFARSGKAVDKKQRTESRKRKGKTQKN